VEVEEATEVVTSHNATYASTYLDNMATARPLVPLTQLLHEIIRHKPLKKVSQYSSGGLMILIGTQLMG